MINIIIFIVLLAIIAILLFNTTIKGIITLGTVTLIALISSYFAVYALQGNNFEVILQGTYLFGTVPVTIDALSAWFILTINFTMMTGVVYGFNYMKKHRTRTNSITLHCIAFLLAHFAMLGICSVQNGFIFLILWELLAISVFILVVFDHHKPETIKAGINYLVQSHISLVFIMLGFIYVAFKTGSYNFGAIEFRSHQSAMAGTALFLCFFTGFAIKAGFVPFHTWLPYAHPAAPSHISGIMSGIVIKIGIYGILRFLLLIRTDYATIGYFILFISLVTGIYGVMQAIVQHDLKKLLAYHSVENIGIIGIGIGIGCIGLGTANRWMAVLGFTGAMLHTLNHSLFKSLLFYCAGNVLQTARTLNIERLGGIIKKMPQTSILFLIGAIAICGLPPLNGFISEFLIYGGIYNWLFSGDLVSLVSVVFSVAGLALIGGLAVLCFTKAFSIAFLGSMRKEPNHEIYETTPGQLFPMYMTVLLMIIIAFCPSFFINSLQKPVNLFMHDTAFNESFIKIGTIESMKLINLLFLGFVLLVLALLVLRNILNRRRIIETGPTWGCGYINSGSKLQYTAGSFARSYSKLAKPILDVEKNEADATEVFPVKHHYKTDSYDKIERYFIDKPIRIINKVTDLFLFLQNGKLQRYILYGIIFITAAISLPLLLEKILIIINFLYHF